MPAKNFIFNKNQNVLHFSNLINYQREKLMNKLLFASIVTALSLGPIFASEPPPPETEMKPLFNGTDLTGWDGDPKLWSVKDGAIRGETTKENPAKDGNTFLVLKEGTYTNFELRLSYRCSASNNSGIQYRSQTLGDTPPKKWQMKGYQHELRNSDILPNVPGFIYDEKGTRKRMCLAGEKAIWKKGEAQRTILETLVDQAAFSKIMKIDNWNDIIIIANGNNIKHYLNGTLTLDFTDEHASALKEGRIAIQLHAGAPMWTEVKNIRIKELK
jgi:Domain of Unknown Function (DUF1080)